MSVYVDNMAAPYGRMIMCHMIADHTEDLMAMADRVGVSRRWVQNPGQATEHFDICLEMRRKAVNAGAIEITMRECALMLRARRTELAIPSEQDRDGTIPSEADRDATP